MAVSEPIRHRIYDWVLQSSGDEEVATGVIEYLTVIDRPDLATKAELFATKAELRAEIADVRVEIAELRADLRTEMHEGFRSVAERFADLERSGRQQLLAILAFNLTFFAGAVAFFR